MTSQRQSELSRLLADKIAGKTQFLQPPQQYVQPSSKGVVTDSTTAQHLISILARIWNNELGENSSTILGGTAADEDDGNSDLIIPTGGILCSLASRRELLPSKNRADTWLQTFLGGPNKLMHICSPTESQGLLDTLYDPQQGISRNSECLITWQLAVGSRFTADTDEQTYGAIYESARVQAEICIEKDDDMLLWVVPTLLLRCLYLMNSKPRNCWLILGELHTFRAGRSRLNNRLTGLAIRVAQTYRIDLQREQCPQLSDADYSRWREVWRAIIFLDTSVSLLTPFPCLTEAAGSQ